MYRLFSHTNTTGAFQTTAMFSASWKAPMFVAPSPKKQTATCSVPRYCADQAAPRAIGRCAPTIAYEPMTPCSTEVRCIEPPLPPSSPVARPKSSAKIGAIGTPRASVWLCPRYVQNVQSSSRIAAATPAATASCPTPRCVVPRTSPSKNSSWARVSNSRHSTIVRYIRRRVAWSMAGAVEAMSVRVRDEQLVGRELRDDHGAVGSDDDLLLDPGRRVAVLGRAVCLERDDHALLELDRVLER